MYITEAHYKNNCVALLCIKWACPCDFSYIMVCQLLSVSSN